MNRYGGDHVTNKIIQSLNTGRRNHACGNLILNFEPQTTSELKWAHLKKKKTFKAI